MEVPSLTKGILVGIISPPLAPPWQGGDWRARELLRRHYQITHQQTMSYGDVEIKAMGDGFMLTFPSALRGVACAVAVQRNLEVLNIDYPEAQLAVRVGLSVG